MATAGVRSPAVRTGALPLVGSTIARVDIGIVADDFRGIYAWWSSESESDERIKDDREVDKGGGEWW